MPREVLDANALPITIPAPGEGRRLFLQGYLIQGTDDGLVGIWSGDGAGAADVKMGSARTTAGGGGALSEDSEVPTSADNVEIIVQVDDGDPGDVTGYIDYAWR